MKAHLVGGGLASLAAAVSLIREAGVLGPNITIYEAAPRLGGAMALSGSAETGYVLPTGRVFEREYRCAFELFSAIPAASDPTISIRDEIVAFNDRHGWIDRARILDREGRILRDRRFGLTRRHRLCLLGVMLTPEPRLEGRRIDELFDADFFETEFWLLWVSLLNALPQHSALEMRRFLRRFLHILPELSTMATVLRTRTNQREAVVRPIEDWLLRQGVRVRTGTVVADVEFRQHPETLTANAIEVVEDGVERTVEVAPEDLVLVTNGSQADGLSTGAMDAPARARPTGRSAALWRRLALGRPGFGNPEAFFGAAHVPDTRWLTFTVTTREPLFFERMRDLTGSEPGRGGLLTLKDSPWLLTIALFHQPEILGQPEDVMLWWGFALYPGRPGDHAGKPATECTGAEVLDETLRHLGLGAERERIAGASICIPCVLPHAGAVWLPRTARDRPAVVPPGATNFGFIGQFAELPEEAGFTMEYSVRSARQAVATLLRLPHGPPPPYRAHRDPRAVLRALRALL